MTLFLLSKYLSCKRDTCTSSGKCWLNKEFHKSKEEQEMKDTDIHDKTF